MSEIVPSNNQPRQLSLWDDVQPKNSPFDTIRHFDENGVEYWLGRELMLLLDYASWQYFTPAVKRAIDSAITAGHNPDDHFGLCSTITQTGRGRQQERQDYKLSRLACYLVAMNGDPQKQSVAEAQTYFAVQTRKQELSQDKKALRRAQDVTGYQLHGKSEAWSRARVDTKDTQKQLNAAAMKTHEQHKPDFASIAAVQNAELFEMTKREIVAYLGLLPKDEPRYRDFLGKYALQALNLVNRASSRQMDQLGRILTTDEQLAIISEQASRAARIMREAADMEGIDFLSGADLDQHGNALIARNVRLIGGG